MWLKLEGYSAGTNGTIEDKTNLSLNKLEEYYHCILEVGTNWRLLIDLKSILVDKQSQVITELLAPCLKSLNGLSSQNVHFWHGSLYSIIGFCIRRRLGYNRRKYLEPTLAI